MPAKKSDQCPSKFILFAEVPDVRLIITILFSASSCLCLAQASMNTSGNWATATNWGGSNIGDLVTETVTISNNVNPTISSGGNFTVGSTTLNNNNTLNINAGGSLNIGDASHARNLTTNNNANISVGGTLIIWGSLVVNNNIVWNITGTVIIKGSVQLNNNANLNVTGGTLQVGGNFTANNNTNISVPSGSISVGGNVSVGGGSNLSGCSGCFNLGGSCSGPAAFCSNSALPVTLISFQGQFANDKVTLEWSTASELNFDHFDVEASADAVTFSKVGEVQGHGTTNSLNRYTFDHLTPFQGITYYRLAAVDFDGFTEYFNVISVKSNNARAISVFPNPTHGEFIQLFVNFKPSPGDHIVIYSNLGVPLKQMDMIASGIFTFQHNLSPGLYLLWYSAGDKTDVIRVSIE